MLIEAQISQYELQANPVYSIFGDEQDFGEVDGGAMAMETGLAVLDAAVVGAAKACRELVLIEDLVRVDASYVDDEGLVAQLVHFKGKIAVHRQTDLLASVEDQVLTRLLVLRVHLCEHEGKFGGRERVPGQRDAEEKLPFQCTATLLLCLDLCPVLELNGGVAFRGAEGVSYDILKHL